MKRLYRSKVRAESKANTIRAILDAALRLHAQGITELQAVAREAGVSLATLRKYFPTREHLFRGCSAHFLTAVEIPSIEALAQIRDPAERLRQVVTQVYALHEAALGPSWLAFRLQGESPAMAQNVTMAEGLVAAAAELLLLDWQPGPGEERDAVAGFARSLLHPLTYRALRLAGGLAPETAARQTALALARLLGIPWPA